MAPRALGALLAVVAVLAFALALAGGVVPKIVPGWWDGHPTVGSEERHRQEVHVGLLGAHGCNIGETTTCQELSTGGRLELIGIAELAALGLAMATGLALVASTWKIGDRRKLLGKLVLVELVLVAAGGGAIFLLGPDLATGSQHIEVPIGLGMFAVMGGIASGALASVIAIRLKPEPLRLKTSMPRMPAGPPAPAFDVRELLRENHDGLRPAVRGPEPRIGVASPGGQLAGPSGPLAPPSAPLFDAAPQLRPLYDVANAGVVPAPVAPPLPMRAPTPLSRDAVGALVGIPTPPPLEPVTPDPASPRTGSSVPPSLASAPRSGSPSVPPARSGASSVPPPLAGPRTGSPSVPPLAGPPPPLFPAEPVSPYADTAHAPSTPANAARGSMPSVPAPEVPGSRTAMGAPISSRGRPSVPPPLGRPAGPQPPRSQAGRAPGQKHPTLAHAVPPPPTIDNQHAPSKLPARDSQVRVKTDADDRASTALRDAADPITAVEIDAEAKARAAADAKAPAGDRTDRGFTAPTGPDHTDPNVAAADRTDQSLAAPPTDRSAAAPRGMETGESVVAPPPAPSAERASSENNLTVPRPRESIGSMPTIARPKQDPAGLGSAPAQDPEDLQKTFERNPKQQAPQPPPPVEPAAAAKVPISTAPASLPPPKKATVAMTTGPTPACPQCEAPMAWVEEHLRFYCAQCRMYF